MSEITDLLAEGVEEFNSWRAKNRAVSIDLSDSDLSELVLEGVDFSGVNLSGADLFGCALQRANLKMADLSDADLSGADLSGAELYKANLTNSALLKTNLERADLGSARLTGADLRGTNMCLCNLVEANLSEADLRESDLSGGDLSKSNIAGANVRFANFSSANVIGMEYLPYPRMRGNYEGIRGLDSCFGNALFVRDAQDQDYLDTLEVNIEFTSDPFQKRVKEIAFKAWGLIDFGRSLFKPAMYATLIAVGFGLLFLFDQQVESVQWFNFSDDHSWLSPFYYSVVTFTTLGYGDILPSSWFGEMLVILEVVVGYSTLGLLLSILANKVARRS